MNDNTTVARVKAAMLSLLDAAKRFDPADPLGAAFDVLERSTEEPWYTPAVAAQLAAKLASKGGDDAAAHLWQQVRDGIAAGEGLSRVEQLAMSDVLAMGEVEPETALMLAEDLHERHGLIATYHAIALGVQLIRYVAELVGDASTLDPDQRAIDELTRFADKIARKRLADKTLGASQ